VSDCSARLFKTELESLFNLKDESGVEILYNVAVTPWFRVASNVQSIRPAAGNCPRAIFVGLGTQVKF